KSLFNLPEPIWIYDGDSFVAAVPAPFLKFTYGIEFDLDAIGTQWYSWNPYRETFSEAIAPARTFGLAHQIKAAKRCSTVLTDASFAPNSVERSV
ncbi:MAG: UDP-3-O-acyl-N-acetylglucosamine deacetylase, partial [Cyanobacteria bacterium J06626_14]